MAIGFVLGMPIGETPEQEAERKVFRKASKKLNEMVGQTVTRAELSNMSRGNIEGLCEYLGWYSQGKGVHVWPEGGEITRLPF